MDMLVSGNVPMHKLILKKFVQQGGKKASTIARSRERVTEGTRTWISSVGQRASRICHRQRTQKIKDDGVARILGMQKEHNIPLNYLWYFEHCRGKTL